MNTGNSSLGVSPNNDLVLGSGLSGMVAAYIHARAHEENALLDEEWSAERAFRLRLPRWRKRKIQQGGTGPAFTS